MPSSEFRVPSSELEWSLFTSAATGFGSPRGNKVQDLIRPQAVSRQLQSLGKVEVFHHAEIIRPFPMRGRQLRQPLPHVFDGRLSVRLGPRPVAWFDAQRRPLQAKELLAA